MPYLKSIEYIGKEEQQCITIEDPEGSVRPMVPFPDGFLFRILWHHLFPIRFLLCTTPRHEIPAWGT
jgi:hypothetical protein